MLSDARNLHPVIAATRALRFTDLVIKRNRSSDDENMMSWTQFSRSWDQPTGKGEFRDWTMPIYVSYCAFLFEFNHKDLKST